MGSIQDDDDVPELSAHTLGALQDFLSERDQRAKQFEDLKVTAEDDFDEAPAPTYHNGNAIKDKKLSMEAFTEDWNVSQFWYNDATATTLARQLLDGATDETRIAVVSTPSVFVQIKNLLATPEYPVRPDVKLLEYDERFSVFKEFVPYDFLIPTRLPPSLKGQFDRIICDPPFLSVDCQTKMALTVRWLSKSWDASTLLIISTGERMNEMIKKLYGKAGVQTTDFEVVHMKLSNEFCCYANFERKGLWQWKKDE
ncbi:putative N6-adenine methyltransferase-domain-containing protein [Phyllosticta citrichinensis]|uniref:Protein-lysine N-methyltransferase EFM5 n=1 Tax=Phyllosticta citrichinensis TaxID=1130410 RepID=A0ABR1Y1K2_9PEZI